MPKGDNVFIDIENGGLRPSDTWPWEVSAVVRKPDGTETFHVWHANDFLPAKADPAALSIGGFYDRHPLWTLNEAVRHGLSISGPDLDVPVDHKVCSSPVIAWQLERLVRDSVTWFCNPVFDVPRLTTMFGRAGFAWTGHYRALCATTYAAGALAGAGRSMGPPPWSNTAVGQALGVTNPTPHRALADAVYARDLVDAANQLAAAQVR